MPNFPVFNTLRNPGIEPRTSCSAVALAATRATRQSLNKIVSIRLLFQDGPFWGTLGVAGSTFTLAYLQAEKLSWLIDTGMITVSKDTEFKIRTAHKLFWSLSAFVGFLRFVRKRLFAFQTMLFLLFLS